MPDIIHYNYASDTSWVWYQTGNETENSKHNYISKKPFDLFKNGKREQFERMGEFLIFIDTDIVSYVVS